MDGGMDGWMDGRMDGWMDGWMDVVAISADGKVQYRVIFADEMFINKPFKLKHFKELKQGSLCVKHPCD